MHTKTLLENVKRDHLEALGIDGRKILESVNWIRLAKNMDQWWGLVGKGNGLLGSLKCFEFLD